MEVKDRYIKFLGALGILLSLMVVIGGFCFRAKIIEDNIKKESKSITSIKNYEKIKDKYILSEYAPMVYDQSSCNASGDIKIQGNIEIKEFILKNCICYKVYKNGNEIYESPAQVYLDRKEIYNGQDKIGLSTTSQGNTFMYILNYSQKESVLKLIGINRNGSTNTKTFRGDNLMVDLVDPNRIKIKLKNALEIGRQNTGKASHYYRLSDGGIIEKDIKENYSEI